MIRLCLPDPLHGDAEIAPSNDQARYLTTVMRLGVGDALAVFNGRDGEWRAVVTEVSRRACRLRVEVLIPRQTFGPDLELITALVKRGRLETIVEKAVELGVRTIRLAMTERTNADHTKVARLQAIAVEAAEQTGRMDVPQVLAPARLETILGGWPGGRRLMFCDEAGDARPALEALAAATRPGEASWSVLIGPEGGFSPAERERLRALPHVTPVTLGPRILRADTAAIAALALWQAALGDWRG